MTHLFLWPLSHDSVACWRIPWRHFMKVTEKTPNLEDIYLEFCNSIWPHLYTVGNTFMLAKHFQKTPKFENAQKFPKNEFFLSIRDFPLRKPAYVRNLLYIIPTYIRELLYTWKFLYWKPACIPRVRDCCFCNPRTPLKNVKKYKFWISSSLGSYATNSFSCNYFVFTPNSSLTI